MNNEIIRYRRELKKQLHCSTSKRRQLLNQLDDSLSAFLEDYPSPSMEQLHSAFGPPEEMAHVLLDTVTKADLIQHTIKLKALRILAGIAVTLFVLFTLYVFYIKEVTIITFENEITPVTTTYQEGEPL